MGYALIGLVMAGQRKRKSKDKPILEIKTAGPGVRPGRIPVPDLIKLCEEVQKAVNRQAEALRGRNTAHPGPIAEELRKDCTLELIRMKRGSTRLQFAPAKSQAHIPFPDQVTFSEEIIGELARTVKDLGNGNKKREADPGVLQAIYRLVGVTTQKRVTAIELIAPKAGDRKRIAAPVNQRVKERIAACLSSPAKSIREIDGILDMADFKPNDLKCRVDPAIGASVFCTFDERDAAKIQRLIRQPVRVVGEATIAPNSNRIDSMHIHSIERLPSLSIGKDNFYAESSLSELASLQKVKPIRDMSTLAGGFPEDEDIDGFLDEIYSARG